MTGMRNRLSVARCCCDCEDCCNGAYPTEWDVEISLADDTCNVCDSTLAGPFTLQLNPAFCSLEMPAVGASICKWGYCYNYDPTFNSAFCNTAELLCVPSADPYDPFDCWVMGYQYITFRVTCINATQYALQAWMKLSAWNPNYFVIKQTINWYEVVDVADWDCDAIVNYCIPFASSSMWYNYPGWPGPFFQLCDASGSEFCVTAVP